MSVLQCKEKNPYEHGNAHEDRDGEIIPPYLRVRDGDSPILVPCEGWEGEGLPHPHPAS